MNKTEIQERITKVESELATLKADLAKCDCDGGIEQEKCWYGVTALGGCLTIFRRTKEECESQFEGYRTAYMPECRQVNEMDANRVAIAVTRAKDDKEIATALHRLGFRMKVTP